MELDRYIASRQPTWLKLEGYLRRVAEGGFGGFSSDELRAVGVLYRQASSDLIYTQTVLQNAELADYLNQIVAAAYGLIYQKSRFSWGAAWRFVAHDFPDLCRRHLRMILLSAAMTLLGLLVGAAAVLADPTAFTYIVPSDYHKLYGEKPDDLRAERFGNVDAGEAAAFSSMIYTNNIRVSFLAFGLGVTYGYFTFVMLFYNGALLGAIAANFHRWDMNLDFWALIIPHGAIEISCIFVAGGAGLMLGRALIRPGRRTRGQALAAAAKEATLIALGVAPWLFLAGLVEGFVTPLAFLDPWAKVAFGVVTGIGFWVYLLIPRKRHA